MRHDVRRLWARAAALTASPARGCQPPAPPVLARCLAQLWFVHCDDKPLQVLFCPPPPPRTFSGSSIHIVTVPDLDFPTKHHVL